MELLNKKSCKVEPGKTNPLDRQKIDNIVTVKGGNPVVDMLINNYLEAKENLVTVQNKSVLKAAAIIDDDRRSGKS